MVLNGEAGLIILETASESTNDKTEFKVLSRNWKIGGYEINSANIKKYVHFDPGLPYMYVPVSDYSQMALIILNSITTNFPTGDIPTTGDSTIYWEKTCDQVILPDYDLTLELFDAYTHTKADHVFNVTLKKERMTIDGKHFGFDSRCYFPIFGDYGNENTNFNNYYLGSHAMYEEYVVYDNTPYDTVSSNYA